MTGTHGIHVVRYGCVVPVQGETNSERIAFESALKMAPSSTRRTPSSSTSQSSSSSSSLSRLQGIAKQMASSISVTSFPAEAVPQAPEDPLFGLMRAYKADESPNKVDLVSQSNQSACTNSRGTEQNLLTLYLERELERIETTMPNHGCSQLLKRFVLYKIAPTSSDAIAIGGSYYHQGSRSSCRKQA